MSYTLPSLITKTITFKRMDNKNVAGYEVYGLFPDSSYSSGIKEELLDKFDNPSEPNTSRYSVTFDYNKRYTWQLPDDMFLDRDHRFKVYVNNAVISSLYYQYNKFSKLLTINKNLKELSSNDKIRIDYYRDMITKTYVLEQNCSIKIKPIFKDTYTYGTHNIII
jgi:hypothetical protein